jgi:outer membrane protein assembly factor BamB
LYCIDLKTHQSVWHANVWTDFGGLPANPESGGFGSRKSGSFPIWAITQNPLIYSDMVIIASQAPEAGVVAYDKQTGIIRWKTPNLGNESYASPTVISIDGKDHIVMVISSTNPIGNRGRPQTLGHVVGIDPSSGKVLWDYDKWNCHISVPSAVSAGNNKVLVVGGYELGATMIQVEKGHDGGYLAKELFTTEEFGDQTKPPLLHNGHFYAQFGTNNKRDGLVCMDMEGHIKWKTEREPDFNKGSMILVDGVILATDGATMLFLIEPDPQEFKVISKAEVLKSGGSGAQGIAARMGGNNQNWAPIALSNGKLLLRDQGQLKCILVGR